ncbi:MAG: N-acetyltransferase family protein [Bacillota bacterium]
MRYKKLKKSDGKNYLKLLKQLDSETSFMLYEPDERKTTIKEMKQKIEQINSRGGVIIGAELNNEIIGFISADRVPLKRIKHSVYIVAGVLNKEIGKGIGTGLFKALIEWAKENGISRFELTVMKHNERAINLYKKIGFEIEGIKKNSLIIDGDYVDEYYMGMIF